MTDWADHLRSLRPRRTTAARSALAHRFRRLTVARSDLARAVGAGLRAGPLYKIVPYKEAYSPQLVHAVLDSVGSVEGSLLDPFAGSGTSLLVAAERGLPTVGVDMLPFAVFAADTLLHASTVSWPTVERRLARVLEHPPASAGQFPDFPVRDWAFTPAALAELTGLHEAVRGFRAGRERDVLRLALLCTVESVSQASKDGTSLRKRPPGDGRPGRFGTRPTRALVRRTFEANVELLREGVGAQPMPQPGSVVLRGDARELPAVLGDRVGHAVSVFSPPYPNRYDYVANYQLELGFGFVRDAVSLRRLRKEQLRSHMEAPWSGARTVALDALEEFLLSYLASEKPTGRVPRMVSGYFEDMAQVFAGLRKVMQPGATVAIVVATQVFAGELLPTDLLLAELAEAEGCTVEEIWVARGKGIAVQQRAAGYSEAHSRESIIILST